MSFGRLFLSLAIVISIAFCALGMPNVINYQGKLTDNTGAGINDSLEMSFRLFNDPLVGAPLWTELHTGANKVFVHKGLFDVALGSITPVNLPFDATYYLEITVDGSILAPRVLLTTSPYAYRAAIADSVVGGSIGDSCLWADHSTDPLIFAKNNDDVIVRDDGDNMGDIYVNMDHQAWSSTGIYVERPFDYYGRHVSNIYAYRGGGEYIENGGTSWDYTDVDAAIKAFSLWGNKYTSAIVGYNYFDFDTSAAVLGAKQDGSFFGALGYSCDGNMYSGYFYGEAVHFHPMSRPFSPVLGDIYTDETTLKMYFYNGVDWVDMTATPGAGASLWTDHATDPYIYANNNANVQVSDATVDTFLTVINHGGTAIKAVGMDYPEPQYGYLGYGGTCPGHPEGWDAAGVMGHTSSYVDAIYGYAEYGGYGVLGVSGYDDDDYGGVGGNNSESGFWGRLGTYYYGGEFTEGIRIQPKDAPPAANEGAIYANSGDKNLYYYDGTSWVDLTAGGGGGVSGSGTVNYLPLWTPTGTALGTSKLRDEGTYTLIHGAGMTPAKPGNFSVAADDATDYFGLWASNFNGRTTAGTGWAHDGVGGGGIYADNSTDSKYYAGLFAFNWSSAETTAAVIGADYNSSNFGALAYLAGGKTWAGYFKGDIFIDGADNDYIYFGNDGDFLTFVPASDFFVLNNDLVPILSYTLDLGSATWKWRDVYARKFVADSISLGGVTLGAWPGGGSSLWTDAGTYISANNNTAARVWDEAQGYGLYYSGANKYGVYGQTSNSTAGASGVYGYANTMTDGSGYGYSSSIAGVKGHCLYGNAYHFGVHGDTYSNDAGSPTAGVIGTFTNDSAIWGALAYKHTDASVWAGYFNGDVHITGDLTIDGDYLHDHWGESWSGSGSQGLRLSNAGPSTSLIDLATSVNGITVTHYNSSDYGAAVYVMEGDGTVGNTYSYAKLALYTDGTLPLNPVNVAVYGRIPAAGGGGYAIYGENTRTGNSQYAGYFNGKVKVDARVETSMNPYCITLTAGENIAVGEVVMVSTTTDLQVVKATTGTETVVGVAVTAATSGNPVTIAIAGAVQVLCSTSVTRGNFVRCGGPAGQVINSGSTGGAGDFGIFLQSIASPAGGLAWMVFKQAEIY